MIDEGIIVDVVLGSLLEVVEFSVQLLLSAKVYVHDDAEQEEEHYHQHAPEGHQNLLALRVVHGRLIVIH
jgi:hypothetical protein